NLAEDAALLSRLLRAGARLERVANEGSFVYVRHGRNAWRFDTGTFLGSSGWTRTAGPPALPGPTIERYRAIGSGPVPVSPSPPPKHDEYVDCLGSTGIAVPRETLRFDRCVALVVSGQYADYLDGALASLARFGGIADVPRVVMVEAGVERCEQIARRHGAHIVRWRSLRGGGSWLKGALYSITRAVEAEQYLCLDADVLVLDSLAPLFEIHAALPAGQVLIGPEATKVLVADLRHGLQSIYLATAAEAAQLLAALPGAERETTVVNDGVFVAGFGALAAVDSALRRAPAVTQWVSARRDVWWRQKAALNLALAQARAIAPLDSAYNAQLHVEGAVSGGGDGRPAALWRGRPAKVLHFNGAGRSAYGAWRRSVLGEPR
ncbi:MAG TPA: hypothetical protein VKU41_20875, partial [Polyangiaceae bacterium]|nr:hypothetical protein [Polyangiaceae bacterium]